MWKKCSVPLIGLTLLLATAATSLASGFAIIEQSVSGLGNAFSSGSANAEDASTIFFNPAAMTLLDEPQVTAAGHIIVPKAEFTASTAVNKNNLSLGTNNSDNAAKIAFVPNLYYATKINDKLSAGIGIFAPFGFTTEYDQDWVGRYHAIESNVMTININPSIAYKATDKLSVGFGISAQYMDVTLSSMVDATGGAAPGAMDVFVNNEADDWGYGFNLGFLYEFNKDTRTGFHYRSQITHKVKGTTTTAVPNPALKAVFPDQGVHGSITLPASASLSVFHQATEKLAFMADVTWTEWSTFDKLVIVFEGTGLAGSQASPTTENWDDTWRYAVGASYQATEKLLLRTGLAYDETPIPDAYRTPRIPGEDRFWVALGFGYQFTESLNLDFAYSHLFVNDSKMQKVATIGTEDENRGTVIGEFENAVDIVSTQISYKF